MTTLPPLSAALWSVREPLRQDLAGTLDRLARIGFTLVEPFDIVSDPQGLRAALAASGLRAPSAHSSVTRDRTPDEVFEAAALVGVGTVVEPMIAEERWQATGGVRSISTSSAGCGTGCRPWSPPWLPQPRVGAVHADRRAARARAVHRAGRPRRCPRSRHLLGRGRGPGRARPAGPSRRPRAPAAPEGRAIRQG